MSDDLDPNPPERTQPTAHPYVDPADYGDMSDRPSVEGALHGDGPIPAGTRTYEVPGEADE